MSPMQLSDIARTFLTERHLATLTTVGPDGTPHVTPVGFTWDGDRGIARVITSGTSRKARNAASGGTVALCQFEGRRWLTLQGTSRVTNEAADVRDAERRYAERYRVPRVNPKRVVIEIAVTRVYGSAEFRD
ncbi:MAG TPA: PPOX class F420-dependent oxidoreductase [Jatrophihabitantaceae bacterium]|nr:PPOX class F420-dependent oxidoreductase [Jatrophihabitantaceae bacterium]